MSSAGPSPTPNSASTPTPKPKIDWVRVALGCTTAIAIGALWYTVYQNNQSAKKIRQFQAKQHDVLGQLKSPPGGVIQLKTTKTTNLD